MGFVDHQKVVRRKEIDNAVGPGSLRTARDVSGVVLDSRTESQLFELFEVVLRPHFDPLRFQQFSLLFEPGDALAQFSPDRKQRPLELLLRRHELLARKDRHRFQALQSRPGQGIEARDPIDRFPKKLDAHRFLRVGGMQFHRVPAHPELAALERDVVPVVLHVDQSAEQDLPTDLQPDMDGYQEGSIVLLASDAVDAGNAGHDDDVPPRHQRTHRREPEPFNLLVHARVLFDERVRARDVGLGLVVVEVADKILDRILREERLELGVQLGRQRLVVRDHQSRPLRRLDHVGDRERLARPGDPQQNLMIPPRRHARGQSLDRFGLVARRSIGCRQFKLHRPTLPGPAHRRQILSARPKAPQSGLDPPTRHLAPRAEPAAPHDPPSADAQPFDHFPKMILACVVSVRYTPRHCLAPTRAFFLGG
jgi:hypothetical protein